MLMTSERESSSPILWRLWMCNIKLSVSRWTQATVSRLRKQVGIDSSFLVLRHAGTCRRGHRAWTGRSLKPSRCSSSWSIRVNTCTIPTCKIIKLAYEKTCFRYSVFKIDLLSCTRWDGEGSQYNPKLSSSIQVADRSLKSNALKCC